MKNKVKNKTDILFFFILLFAIFIRIWKFGEIPSGINQDGAMAAVDAKALADYGTDRFGMKFPVHFTAWGYGQMSVLLSYCMIPFIKLFGLSVITARLPIVIISMLAMVVLYVWVKELFGEKPALFISFLLAINPWHMMQSRWALDCNLFPHIFVIGLYFLTKGMKKKKYLYLSMVFFALCMYSYGIAFYSVPFFLLFSCIYLLRKQLIVIKDSLICIGIYFFLSWPIYLVMFINTIGMKTIQTPFFTIPYFEHSVRSNDILFFAENPIQQFFANLSSTFQLVVMQKYDLPWNTIEQYGSLYLWTLPFVIIGGIFLYEKIKKESNSILKASYLFLFAFLGMGIIVGLLTKEVNTNRINIIFYPLLVLAGLGLFSITKESKKLAIALLGCYAIFTASFVSTYFGTYANHISYYFYSDFVDALDYAEQLDCTTYYITPDVQYKGSTAVSEILTLFCHELDAHYYNGLTNKSNGKEYHPYTEQYQYKNPSDLEIDPSEDAIYIIQQQERDYFEPSYFTIKDFTNYAVVIPNNKQS